MKTRLAMCFLLAAPLACSDNNLADDGSGGAGGAATASGSAGSGGAAVGPGGGSSPGGGAGTTGGGAGSPGAGGNAGSPGLGGSRGGGSGGGVGGVSGGAGGVLVDGGSSDAGARDGGADVNPADICGATGVCPGIEREWNDAVRKDQACSPGMANQCTLKINGIGCGGCPVAVNGTVNTDAVRKKWQDAGCARCVRICPAILCIAPGPGACQAVAMGGVAVIGQCVIQRATPL